MLSVAFDDLSFSPERMPSPTPPSLQQVLIILESIILYPVRDPSVAEAPPKGWSYDVCYSPLPLSSISPSNTISSSLLAIPNRLLSTICCQICGLGSHSRTRRIDASDNIISMLCT